MSLKVQMLHYVNHKKTNLPRADVDQAFHTLLEKSNKISGEDTSEGSAVYVDDGFKPKPEFLDTLKQSYLADGFTVDFANAADSANTINEYVKEKTGGKIEEMVSNLDPSTVMYLISYIYYKGKWETPFDPKLTEEETFTVDESSLHTSAMMHAALGIWILSAVICVGRGDPESQDTAPDNSANNVLMVTAAYKEFAYRLYRQLAAHRNSQGKNIFFSPSSVSVALAALSVGAGGETHQQLFSGLGFNSTLLTQADVDQAFHTLLEKSNKISGEDTSEGTAVYVDDGFKPKPEFLDTLKQSYLADGFTVDFANAADSANTINEYVKEKTGGKIEEMVSNLDPSTVMYLISYIYYKGKWETSFDPKLTKEETFTVDETTKVQVQMMYMKKIIDIYYDQALNTSVLHLPFNSSYSMLLMLPDDMATLENGVSQSHVTKWLKWMKPRKYEIYVPKFSIKTSQDLNEVLILMGMTDMFTERADFRGIVEDPPLMVSEVVHKATLDVDEEGAVAAASTGFGIIPWSVQPVLKFDHPFMLMIIERNTESINFMGKIINPKI